MNRLLILGLAVLSAIASADTKSPGPGSLANLASIPSGTLLGNSSGSTAAPSALTTLPSTVTTIGNAINVTNPTYGVIGNGIQETATVSISSGSHALTATGAAFAATDIGKMITVPGAGVTGATLTTTISGYSSATAVTLTAAASTTVTTVSESITYGTDNTTALQAAITAAVAANKPLYLPSVGNACYAYTPPLTIVGNLTVVGDYVAENWGLSSYTTASVPTGSPVLQGSVLCPASNGSDAIDVTGSSPVVNVSNIGILFQAPFVGTGHGINATPPYTTTSNEIGLSGSHWENLKIYGHDGNHYAYLIQNPFYDNFISLHSYGGGAISVIGKTLSTLQYGNSTFINPYGEIIVGGSANGINLNGATSGALQLLTFIRPQMFVQALTGISPSGNLPTAAQYTWNMDANEGFIRVIAPDMESAGFVSPTNFISGVNNYFDLESAAITGLPANTNGGSVFHYAPSGGPGNSNGGSYYIQPGSLAGSGANGNVVIVPQGSSGKTTFILQSTGTGTANEVDQDFFMGGTLQWKMGMYNSTPNQWFMFDQGAGWTDIQLNSGTNMQLMKSGGPVLVGTAAAGPAGSVTAQSLGTIAYTIGTLPTCNAGEAGQAAYVSNGVTSPTYLGTVSTTGSTVAPVFCNGTNWIYH